MTGAQLLTGSTTCRGSKSTRFCETHREHAIYSRHRDADDGLKQSRIRSGLQAATAEFGGGVPDDDDDAVEYVVGVPDVSKQAEGQQHEPHLQDKHAGENDVADLQDVGQLLGLQRDEREGVNSSTFTWRRENIRFTDTRGCWSLVLERSAAAKVESSQLFLGKSSTLETC